MRQLNFTAGFEKVAAGALARHEVRDNADSFAGDLHSQEEVLRRLLAREELSRKLSAGEKPSRSDDGALASSAAGGLVGGGLGYLYGRRRARPLEYVASLFRESPSSGLNYTDVLKQNLTSSKLNLFQEAGQNLNVHPDFHKVVKHVDEMKNVPGKSLRELYINALDSAAVGTKRKGALLGLAMGGGLGYGLHRYLTRPEAEKK